MYFYEYNNGRIDKFLVNIDEEKLENLRNEIINNCSEIIHRDITGIKGPNYFDYLKIRNYSEKRIGVKENSFYADEIVYRFTYDEYIYPYLILLIEKLKQGETRVIGEIRNPDLSKEKTSYDQRIIELSKELDNIDNLNIIEKRNKLDELEKLIEIAKLNENQKSVYIYYLKVQQLIALELVDSINISEISKVINFFDLSKTNEIENEIQKKLELHNIRGSHAANN